MDDPITLIFIMIFIILVVWGWIQRSSGDYEGDGEYEESYSDDNSWSSSRRSNSGSSFFRSSSRSSSSSSRSSFSSNRSNSSFSSSKPVKTKAYDSSKIQSRGGFGRNKK